MSLKNLRLLTCFLTLLAIPAFAQEILETTPEELVPTPASRPDDSKSSLMKLVLKEGLEMAGTPVELDAIKMDSLFGEATIPLDTIAGIRFGKQAGEQTTVVLLNGDSLTGEISLDEIKFVAEWGEATVFTGHIDSIVFRSDLAWSSVSTPNGPRWRLTKIQRNLNPTPAYRVYRSQ